MPGLHGGRAYITRQVGPPTIWNAKLLPAQICAAGEYWSVEWFNRVDGPMRRASSRETSKQPPPSVSLVFRPLS